MSRTFSHCRHWWVPNSFNYKLFNHFNNNWINEIDSGAQPLVNDSGNVILCVNGEIYNHKSLRRHLKKEHVFKTHSDCEIILYLYEEMGPDFVGLLDGMFSFVLYDKEKDIYVSFFIQIELFIH